MTPQALTEKELAQVAKIRAQRFGNPEGLVTFGLDKEVKTVSEITRSLDSYANNLQTDWNVTHFLDLSNGFGESLQDALDSVGIVIDTIKPVITLITTAMEVLLTGSQIAVDLFSDVFKAAILLLEAIVDLFNSTGMHELQYIPKNRKMFKSTRRLVNIIADSYDDEADPARPISRSASDTHLFVGILPAFADWSKLIDVLKELAKLFKFDTSGLKGKEFDPEKYPNYGNIINGVYPNWRYMSLSYFSFVHTITQGLNKLIASLRTTVSKIDAYKALLKSISARLAQIEATIKQVLDVLEALLNQSILPINILTIFGPGDISGLQSALRASTHLKSYPLGKTDVDISAAICLHFSLGAGKSLEFVKSLFAIKEKATDEFGEPFSEKMTKMAQAKDSVGKTFSNSQQQMDVLWRAPTGGQGTDDA